VGRLKSWGFRIVAPFLKIRFRRHTRAAVEALGLEEGMLSGYKTYVLAGVAVIAVVAGWLVGDSTLASAFEEAWKILFPLIAMALRAGVKSDVKF